MNKETVLLPVARYRDAEGPVCSRCYLLSLLHPNDDCRFASWDRHCSRFYPGPDCPIWKLTPIEEEDKATL